MSVHWGATFSNPDQFLSAYRDHSRSFRSLPVLAPSGWRDQGSALAVWMVRYSDENAIKPYQVDLRFGHQ